MSRLVCASYFGPSMGFVCFGSNGFLSPLLLSAAIRLGITSLSHAKSVSMLTTMVTFGYFIPSMSSAHHDGIPGWTELSDGASYQSPIRTMNRRTFGRCTYPRPMGNLFLKAQSAANMMPFADETMHAQPSAVTLIL